MAARHGSLLMRTLQPSSTATAAITKPSAPPAPPQPFIRSTWDARISFFFFSFLFFFSTIRTTKWKYIIPVSLAAREREIKSRIHGEGWVTWRSWKAHKAIYKFIFNLPPCGNPAYTPGIPFFWLTRHVKLINTNLSPPARKRGETERQVTPCTQSYCWLVLFSGDAP